MKHTTSTLWKAIVCSSALIACTTACKNDPDVTDPYLTPFNIAVTEFSLNEDDDVMENLDSVFFSIDLKNKVIFNADSLPVGTKIDKLIASISYSDYVTEAKIVMEDGQTRTGEINYLESPTDSIDFTGKVTLKLVCATQEGDLKMDYRLKVLVHKEKVDSLMWGDKAYSQLPSRMNNPKNQKSIDFKGKAVSLIEENDGSFTFASSSDLYNNSWQKAIVNFPFTPDVRSLVATSEKLVILDTDGNMFESTDGSKWSGTGEKWSSIIGAYLNTAIGLKENGQHLVYSQYPKQNINECTIDKEFPTRNASNFVILTNKWTSSPVGFFVGGRKTDGTLSNATWAFDGTNWVKLSEGGIPAFEGATIVPYYGYRFTNSQYTKTEYPVWMILGGTKSDNKLSRTVYISYDNGVNWGEGGKMLQLPEEIPAMTQCDNVVMYTKKSANLSDYWTRAGGSTPEVDGDILKWDCPYIYLIGGSSAEGMLYNSIWRGVLARLTFTPII